jgi:hypothetical protein
VFDLLIEIAQFPLPPIQAWIGGSCFVGGLPWRGERPVRPHSAEEIASPAGLSQPKLREVSLGPIERYRDAYIDRYMVVTAAIYHSVGVIYHSS